MPTQGQNISTAEFASLSGADSPFLETCLSGDEGDDVLDQLDFSDLNDTDGDATEGTDSSSESDSHNSEESQTLTPMEDHQGEDSPSVDGPADDGKPKSEPQVKALLSRMNDLLGSQPEGAFFPTEPESLKETGLTEEEVERLILKYLLSKGSALGRRTANQICLPFNIVEPILKYLKNDQMLALKGAAEMGDYDYAITDFGRDRARRYSEECTYFGAAPVSMKDYLAAMAAQSVANEEVTEEDLREAFSDLILSEKLLDKLGPAINSGRGMFLFGEPGNGKTSIAERITKCFGSSIWIPRALGIDGDIIRIYDPGVHEIIEDTREKALINFSGVDGGELTMSELEVVQNPQTKICEAPLQLKSNCGTLVIDDFGRQTMPVDVLLNRWIVPLEKRYDFLNMPSGKKIQVPFDQLIIFSTNLEPKDLVDGAFLRRIPYKIEVPDPSEEEFITLMKLMAPNMGFQYEDEPVRYLIETHYRAANRPFRACQPRDLLLQVRNFCTYKRLPKILSSQGFDFAVENYFAIM